MATFRERVEAILQVKDAARFKAQMEVAAKAVDHLAKSEAHAERQGLVLDEILKALKHQTAEVAAAFAVLSHEVNALGHEMVAAAAETEAANVVMKKSGNNAVFLGKSWAFWKDRLSLTRSEIMTTAITLGTYLAPALVAVGSSFAYAAMGGGGGCCRRRGGSTTFITGLGLIATTAMPVIKGMKKITAAQYQYNVTVEQYGAASIQASRSNAHLYAVIQNNGGPAVAQIIAKFQTLRDLWQSMTKPGQADFADILSGGLKAGSKLAPTAATAANSIMKSLKSATAGAFDDLSGPGGIKTLQAMGSIFSDTIGPGLRGAVNLIQIFGRVIRASAPWLKQVATWWERLTLSWRKKATLKSVTKFLDDAVGNFRVWWRLIMAVGRAFTILISSTHSQGEKFVQQITTVVEKFDDWLQLMKDTGSIDRFFNAYIDNLKKVVGFLQHPIDTLDAQMPAIIGVINSRSS